MGEKFALLSAALYHPGTPRVVAALARQGAEVCVVAPRESYVAQTRFKRADILMPFDEMQRKLPAILHTLADGFGAQTVLIGDEATFDALAILLQRGVELSAAARSLLTRSLPPLETALRLMRESEFIATQPDGPLAPPRSLANPSEAQALQFAGNVGFPVIVKIDSGGDGHGVRRCANADELRAALAQKPSAQGFLVQQFVRGKVHAVVLSGIAGQAAAAFAYVKFVTAGDHGPSTVIKRSDRADIISHALALYQAHGLSGYASVDYIVDESGRAYLLEINRAISAKTHLTCFGVDLTAAMLARMRGAQTPPPTAPTHDAVACFPTEWARDPGSVHLTSALHDVPWDDPDVAAAMVATAHRQRGATVLYSPL